MANSGYSSPFPTSHDTIGVSTMITPLVMPSSPPNIDREEDAEPLDSPAKSPTVDRVAAKTGGDRDEEEEEEFDARQREIDSPVLSRASSPDHAARDLDARLADYSIDFSRFPSTQFGGDKEDDLLPDMKPAEEDKLSDVGGPEDFTANLERYLMGDDDDEEGEFERKEVAKEQAADGRKQDEEQKQQEQQDKDQAHEQPEQNSKVQQPTTENEAELGEYSEFGPPIDMSTPSHLLHRTAGGLAKDVTHLEGIEEGSDDEINTAATPSAQKQRRLSDKAEEEKNDDLHRQLADLRQALQDRDEQVEKNHKRVLEAASAGEQIRHLQAELQRKTTLLDELHEQRSDEELLREQVQLLQKQTHEQELSLQKSTVNATDMSTLQQQMAEMQKELQNGNTHNNNLDAERLENIAHLRQQLGISQEQLKKKDATLDETIAKLKEVATAKEQQLREKNTEIDGLRAQIDDQSLEIEKLETDVERSNTAYQTLEGRISSLETKNRPLEEKNSTLEADLTRAQSQVTAQENALKAMAADLPSGNGGQKTFTEILDLIKDLGPSEDDAPDPFLENRDPREYEIEHLRHEVTRLQDELSEASVGRKTIEAELAQSREQATEAQSLFKSIEDENTRLTKRADELKSTTDETQRELSQARADHSTALQTIQRLQEEKNTTVHQPSPPPSPPTAQTNNNNNNANTSTLQAPHQTQLKALQTAHTNSTRKLQNLLSTAEKRESRLRGELQSLRDSYSTQESQLETLSAEVQRLESALTVKDETAAVLDERIARSVEKREKEWQRRVDLLLKERDRMGRALLWTWGEKEVGDNHKENGIGEDGRKLKQGYRYKYAQPQPQSQSRRRDGKRVDA